jgi:hypothetical protein
MCLVPGLSPSQFRFPASDMDRWLKSRRGDFDQRFATSARGGRSVVCSSSPAELTANQPASRSHPRSS